MKWVDNPFSPNNPNRPKETLTLEKNCDMMREGISDHYNPLVMRDAIVRIMIIRHGPRDKDEINRILTGLYVLKEESKNMEETEFYLLEIEAYERLYFWLYKRPDYIPYKNK